ncbi:hypothetical protein ACUR5C_00905 [Aliikangiella sp. IMCC44653]
MNLWLFLSLAVGFSAVSSIIIAIFAHKKSIKELEVEALKVERANLDEMVEKAVKKHLGDQLSRIEVLEAIVTDKKYELNEKIARLKS